MGIEKRHFAVPPEHHKRLSLLFHIRGQIGES